MKRLVLKAIAAAAVLATFGVAQAQEIREHTIKFATQNPKGHPMVLGMERFAENVSKKSGGKIKVNLFPGGVLGGDQANVSAVQGGTLEMVVLNTGILASVAKELAIFDFPFLISSAQEADALVDGPVGKRLHAKLEDKGIIGLGFYELGFRNITNSKRPLTKVEDIAGLKLRVIPTPINVDWVKALDANPTLGNNEQLGAHLGMVTEGTFGDKALGVIGRPVDGACTLEAFAARVGTRLGRTPVVAPGDGRTVQRVAWCTGGAQGWFDSAIAAGADVYLTGEISEPQAHIARETGVAFMACGHHATERYGVQALGAHLAAQFGLAHQFIDIDNPG